MTYRATWKADHSAFIFFCYWTLKWNFAHCGTWTSNHRNWKAAILHPGLYADPWATHLLFFFGSLPIVRADTSPCLLVSIFSSRQWSAKYNLHDHPKTWTTDLSIKVASLAPSAICWLWSMSPGACSVFLGHWTSKWITAHCKSWTLGFKVSCSGHWAICWQARHIDWWIYHSLEDSQDLLLDDSLTLNAMKNF